jgi:hypothetical protein
LRHRRGSLLHQDNRCGACDQHDRRPNIKDGLPATTRRVGRQGCASQLLRRLTTLLHPGGALKVFIRHSIGVSAISRIIWINWL